MFYVIEVGGDDAPEKHVETLRALAQDLKAKVPVKMAWVQDERDITPPAEARYQRRQYT